MKTVIMAGGKGTRIASVANNIPKPMIPIEGKPVLERELICLRDQGFDDIIITVSYLGHIITDYFGNGDSLGLHIDYYCEKEPLGNAGALFRIKDKLTDDFLLINGDAVFDIDFNKFVEYHKSCGGLVTLFTHPNSHPYDSGVIVSDMQKRVINWLTKEDERPLYYKNRVNAGLHVMSPIILEQKITSQKIDLDRQLLKPLAGSGQMFVYDSPEYVKDMGTPDRYDTVCKDFAHGRVHAKNLMCKQKAVFIDRDGTINEYAGFITKPEQFQLKDGVAEAIRKINNSGYLAIVVSNQPVIARGDCTIEELDEIHNKMETLLGREGAYVDDIFYCPHHPDKGFIGERLEYKIICDCRKPKPGMLLNAAKKYNIDLEQSYMIGDSDRDIEAGLSAGCQAVYIGEDEGKYKSIQKIIKCSSLVDFTSKYINIT